MEVPSNQTVIIQWISFVRTFDKIIYILILIHESFRGDYPDLNPILPLTPAHNQYALLAARSLKILQNSFWNKKRFPKKMIQFVGWWCEVVYPPPLWLLLSRWHLRSGLFNNEVSYQVLSLINVPGLISLITPHWSSHFHRGIIKGLVSSDTAASPLFHHQTEGRGLGS